MDWAATMLCHSRMEADAETQDHHPSESWLLLLKGSQSVSQSSQFYKITNATLAMAKFNGLNLLLFLVCMPFRWSQTTDF